MSTEFAGIRKLLAEWRTDPSVVNARAMARQVPILLEHIDIQRQKIEKLEARVARPAAAPTGHRITAVRSRDGFIAGCSCAGYMSDPFATWALAMTAAAEEHLTDDTLAVTG